MVRFTHLHVHSEYSLLDGAARIHEMVERAASSGMTSLALTDHGVMYGAIAFYKACKARGIKPIIGCEVYFTSGSRFEKGTRQDNPIYHLILLAQNHTGYQNLMALCSIGQLEGFHYRPRIDAEVLERHSEGIICLSACLGGEVSQHLLHDRYELAKAAAERYRAIFGDRFYLELQDHGMLEQKQVNQQLIKLSMELSIPLVATNDVHYVQADDYAMQDILICIGTGKTLEDEERLKFHTNEMYLKSTEEMAQLFLHVPEAIENTQRIVDLCELELELGRSILPEFSPLPSGMDAEAYLHALCNEGLVMRYHPLDSWHEVAYRDQVETRLRYELEVICEMGFADYFLIVWDFIRFARERGIAIGPGRGSSAGSLVAYVLRITDIDPIRYRLLFERFLNPERISMPDIDIDFSDERRDEVIHYVSVKYGKAHVAQIITFGTMAAKAAVRDVGRVLNIPYQEVDRTAKMIPNSLGITIEEALRLNPELETRSRENEQVATLIEMARRVEGFTRHASTHAAGVVISREPLIHYTPLQAGNEHTPLTQYSMEHLEAIGLLKMDFLGLRTLSIIERTLKGVEAETGIQLNFHKMSDDDAATYELLSRGETTGIFQLESAGMRRVLKELKPNNFEDIISVLALYRPGPMEFIPKYIQAKHGQVEIEYPHPKLKGILQDTYGIIVYQEQIMQIASTMAGFSLGESDLLRRAVSKKKRDILDEERAHFLEGCQAQGYSVDEGNRVYDMIVRFADYGFPRAHAAAYGVLAYQTAYLKTHYPAHFMASMLTSVMGNHKKVAEYIDECRRMGIEVLPPDVNESLAFFTPQKVGQAVRFGLAAVKNVGFQAIEQIEYEREKEPFASLLEFCQRIDLRMCNRRVIESLISAGAFDLLPGHRAQKLSMLDETIETASKWKKENDDLQLHLFGFQEQANWSVALPDVPPHPAKLQLELEREMLGLYLSGHPLEPYEAQLARFEPTPLHHLVEVKENSIAVVAGLIVSCKRIVSRKGQAMAFLELEDQVDKVEVVVFPDAWAKYGPIAQQGKLILLRARVQHDEENETVKLLAEQLYAIDDLPEKLAVTSIRPTRSVSATKVVPVQRHVKSAQKVYIKVASEREDTDRLKQLHTLLRSNQGDVKVILYYEREHKAVALNAQFAVKPSPYLFQAIEELFGEETVKVR